MHPSIHACTHAPMHPASQHNNVRCINHQCPKHDTTCTCIKRKPSEHTTYGGGGCRHGECWASSCADCGKQPTQPVQRIHKSQWATISVISIIYRQWLYLAVVDPVQTHVLLIVRGTQWPHNSLHDVHDQPRQEGCVRRHDNNTQDLQRGRTQQGREH